MCWALEKYKLLTDLFYDWFQVLVDFYFFCMGLKDFLELIQSEIFDAAVADSGVIKSEMIFFQESDEGKHFILVLLNGGFFSLLLLL
jgi:hypothetical protein